MTKITHFHPLLSRSPLYTRVTFYGKSLLIWSVSIKEWQFIDNWLYYNTPEVCLALLSYPVYW